MVAPATGKPYMQDLGPAGSNLLGRTPQVTQPSTGSVTYTTLPVTGDTPYVPPNTNVGRPGIVGASDTTPGDDDP